MSLWDVLVSIFWFMMLFAWIWLLISIFGDLFRDHELSGWGKAFWTFFLIVLPWLGALVYLIARGRSMNERPSGLIIDHPPRMTCRTRAAVTLRTGAGHPAAVFVRRAWRVSPCRSGMSSCRSSGS